MAVFEVLEDRGLAFKRSVPMGFGEVRDWAMSPGGDYIITASNEGHVGAWAIDTGDGNLTLVDAQTGYGNAVTVEFINPE